MRRPDAALPLRHAVALGVLHGPTELLPISSSAHTTLVPWLLGWPYADLDPELRKAFEVALHAGTAAALLVGLRDEVAAAARGLDRRRAVLILGLVRAAGHRRLHARAPDRAAPGHPAHDRRRVCCSARRPWPPPTALGPTGRRREEAGFADALALGLAQACALIPGASRNGMTLAAARLRGFDRADANALSRHVALPVIVGATALKGARLARRGVPPALGDARSRPASGAAFVSTLASVRIIRAVERDRSFAPYAAYRALLAAVVLRRAWQNRSR